MCEREGDRLENKRGRGRKGREIRRDGTGERERKGKEGKGKKGRDKQFILLQKGLEGKEGRRRRGIFRTSVSNSLATIGRACVLSLKQQMKKQQKITERTGEECIIPFIMN